MSTLNADLYDALKAAKVDDAIARRAAESVTAQPQRTETLERDVREGFQAQKLQTDFLASQLRAVESELRALTSRVQALEIKMTRLDVQMKLIIAGVAALVLRGFFFPS